MIETTIMDDLKGLQEKIEAMRGYL